VDGTLWVTNTDGSQQNIFAEVPGPGWLTRCARYIVLTSVGPGVVTLVRLDADGSNPVKLVGGSLWSPRVHRMAGSLSTSLWIAHRRFGEFQLMATDPCRSRKS
jgi:hypothetical protein